MRCAHFRRAEEPRLIVVAQSRKSIADRSIPGKEGWHVLDEDQGGTHLTNEAHEVRPERAVVLIAASASRDRVGLARQARRDKVHRAAPAATIEGGEVVPDRRRVQMARFHKRDQARGGKGLPLHDTDSAVPGAEDETEAEFESGKPGTYSQAMQQVASALATRHDSRAVGSPRGQARAYPLCEQRAMKVEDGSRSTSA